MTNTKSQSQNAAVAQPMDSLLFWLTFLLLGVGIVSVYDASYALAIEHLHDSFHYVKLQAGWAVVGLVTLWVTKAIPYWKWRAWAIAGVAISALLLVAVLIHHVGIGVGGARRWVGYGPFRIQPSELAKLALVLYLARVAGGNMKMVQKFDIGLLRPLAVIGVLAVLIALEPDLGTAMVLGGTGLVLLFLAGARPRHMAGIVAVVAVAVGMYAVSKPYRLHRLTAFLDPKGDQYHTGYQVWHALIALGSGGVTGLGLGEGREKLYIPMARTDFIFPVIAEEWGLIGTLILVTVFVLIAARGFAIAYRTKDPFGALLAAGITTMISLQALVNMSVATASIPNTGVPLPFISYGGSSLVLMMAGIGLLLNISRYPEGAASGVREEIAPNETDWNRRWERRPVMVDLEPKVTLPAARRDSARMTSVTRRLDKRDRPLTPNSGGTR